MSTVLPEETGASRPTLRVTLSPRLTLVWVVKPPRSGLGSEICQEVVPVLHWFSFTTGIGLGQATAALAAVGKSTQKASRRTPRQRPSRSSRSPSGEVARPKWRLWPIPSFSLEKPAGKDEKRLYRGA